MAVFGCFNDYTEATICGNVTVALFLLDAVYIFTFIFHSVFNNKFSQVEEIFSYFKSYSNWFPFQSKLANPIATKMFSISFFSKSQSNRLLLLLPTFSAERTTNHKLTFYLYINFIFFRYVSKNTSVYAFVLDWPKDDTVFLSEPMVTMDTKVTMLGLGRELNWVHKLGKEGLQVSFTNIRPREIPCDHAWVLKLDGVK